MTKQNTENTAPEEPDENGVGPTVQHQDGPVPTMAELHSVRYTGTSDVRILTVADLERVGVQGVKNDLVFDASNNHRVGAEAINAAARDWFAEQSDFVVE